MKRFNLFVLQLRSAAERLLAGLLIMAVLFGVIFAGAHLYMRSAEASGGLIRVAVVADDSGFSDYVFEMADDIPGVSSICTLEKEEPDEALDGLRGGEIGLVIEIPDDFYEKTSTMQEAHLKIYTNGTPSKSVYKLLGMLGSVSGLMEITDAQILSMYDTIEAYDLPVTRTAMEWEFFSGTLARFEKRTDFMDVKTVSAYGSYDLLKFYLTGAFLCMMLLGGVTLFGMYTGEQMRLERTLDRGRTSYLRNSLSKICAIWISMGLIGELLLIILNRVLIFIDTTIQNTGTVMQFSTRFHICLWTVALSAALWIHLIAGLVGTDSAHFRVVYVTLMLILLIASGVMVPAVYLPGAFRSAAGIIPTGTLHRMLLSGMWDTGHIRGLRNINGFIVTLITDDIIFVISLILYRRRQYIHD
ncbi:ABC-2 family transporter protein [Lachnospiraceae bacterium XBB2008]|nr:ABC-2 family transporter protein [Lachnospiraceae bacterium XBB2008]